ncbi:Major allergen Pru av 1 [Morella rubra]|uniref:Major allergen Pru av 1 n=1 Tax=Morella rubra TaxID=262757 RepID=A0A6A1VM88_9ROSI|nr:Major allergen Pru av 1 [Morella rubra]
MGCFAYEDEATSVLPPAKLFKAFILDGDNLIPKVAPQAIQKAEIIEGDGGPGTIRKITFGEGSQFKYAKHKIDEVDEANFKYNYSVIELDDALGDKLEKISYETKLVPSPDGGTIWKTSSKYYTKGDHEIKEEQIKAGKDLKSTGLFKAVESYLVAHLKSTTKAVCS